MGKGHARNEDTYLNKSGVNEVTAVNAKDAVDKKHQQNSDTILNNGGVNHVTASEIVKNIYNTVILGFKLAIQASLTVYNMLGGITDTYEDESGIDTVNSVNQQYNPSNDYYSPVGGFDEYVKFLCHFDGEEGQTTAEDESASGHIITFVGDAKLSTSQKKFGTASLALGNPPSGDYITVPNHADFQYTTESFTIDGWFYFLGNPGATTMIMSNSGGGGGFQYGIWGGTVTFYNIGGLAYGATVGFSPTLNQWYHIELSRSGTELRYFINGLQLGDTLTIPASLNAGTGTIFIGSDGNAADRSFPGFIDEFRVSKGIARHTSNFTPPTSAYAPTVENMTLISDIFVADDVPSNARIVVLEEDIDSITLNTDLKARITRDGTNWEEVTLEEEIDYDIGKRILIGVADLSGQNSNTNMQYKYITDNQKSLRLYATALLWD
jgi:hypothetical protein